MITRLVRCLTTKEVIHLFWWSVSFPQFDRRADNTWPESGDEPRTAMAVCLFRDPAVAVEATTTETSQPRVIRRVVTRGYRSGPLLEGFTMCWFSPFFTLCLPHIHSLTVPSPPFLSPFFSLFVCYEIFFTLRSGFYFPP